VIDWLNLAANSLWILGCAIALAAFSLASWEASIQHEKLRHYLQKGAYQAVFSLAGLLFCLGLAILASRWWETALWLALATWFALQLALPRLLARNRS
jgi:hypothetical protein